MFNCYFYLNLLTFAWLGLAALAVSAFHRVWFRAKFTNPLWGIRSGFPKNSKNQTQQGRIAGGMEMAYQLRLNALLTFALELAVAGRAFLFWSKKYVYIQDLSLLAIFYEFRRHNLAPLHKGVVISQLSMKASCFY
mgnify:CR=1 FL=1